MVADRDLVNFNGWPRGLNNVVPEHELTKNMLRGATNIDLDDEGKPRRRKGFIKKYSGAGIHSLFEGASTLFVEGSDLKRLNRDYTANVVRSGLTPGQNMSYAEVNGETYFSNGVEKGKINSGGTAKSWGVAHPAAIPVVRVGALNGSLDAGRYQTAITFETGGEESGTGLAAVVDIKQGESIQLSGIPSSSEEYVNIYASEPNGDTLYWQTRIPMNVATYNLFDVTRGRNLETQFAQSMPAGHIVRYFAGRMWVAEGSVLWCSDPFRFGLFRPATNFFQYSSRISVLEVAQNGLYVAADKTYFLAGTNPLDMAQIEVDSAGGVEGTGTQVPARMFEEEGSLGDLALWCGERGVIVGYPGGAIRHLTENNVAVPRYARGAVMLREEEGVRQIVSNLRTPGEMGSFGASDSAVAEVRRNGIVI